MRPFNYYEFHRKRKFLKLSGLILSLLGFFTIVDMAWKVPIPLTGIRALFTGIVLIIFGVLCLYQGYKLPLAEALEIIHQRGQGITASELVHEMRVDRITADRMINALVHKGFLRSSANSGMVDEVFEAVR
jgi:uncharacterized membrane protein